MRLFLFLISLSLACGATSSCAAPQRKAMAYFDHEAAPPPMAEAQAHAPQVRGAVVGAAVGGSNQRLLAPAPVDDANTQPQKKASKNRKVIYTGTLSLLVSNKATGRQEIDKVIKKYDGLIVSATLDEVTFRVDPAQFEAAVNDLTQLGEVASREIKSEDVTAQFFDLNLRAEVAEGSRQRLMEILKKTGAVKDVLEVERDIRRLTEEIETIKGMIRKMQDQIDMATIIVRLSEKQIIAQPRRHSISSNFSWMNCVGLNHAIADVGGGATLDGGSKIGRLFLGKPFSLAVDQDKLLPEEFLPVLYDGEHLIGVTAQDNRLRVQRLELRQEGPLDFWRKALEEEFKSYRGYIVLKSEPFSQETPNLRAVVIRCETAVGSEPWAYDMWLIQDASHPKRLYTVEYARVKRKDDLALAEVEKSIRGFKVR